MDCFQISRGKHYEWKSKSIKRSQEGEKITYKRKKKVSKYIVQNLTGRRNRQVKTEEDFYLLSINDETSKQKISQYIEHLNSALNQHDPVDTQHISANKNKIHIFSRYYGTLTKIYHI